MAHPPSVGLLWLVASLLASADARIARERNRTPQHPKYVPVVYNSTGALGMQLGWQMSDLDRRFFDSVVGCVLSGPDATYVEFGSGGTTERVLRTSHAQVYSVDSYPEWLSRVRRSVPVDAQARFHPIAVDIGRTRETKGYPLGRTSAATARGYYKAADSVLPRADLILIDGRWRVNAALNALKLMKRGTVVLVHDFWARPRQYGSLLLFADLVVMAGPPLPPSSANGTACPPRPPDAPSAWPFAFLSSAAQFSGQLDQLVALHSFRSPNKHLKLGVRDAVFREYESDPLR